MGGHFVSPDRTKLVRFNTRRSRILRPLRAVLLPLASLCLITCAEDPVGLGSDQAGLQLRPIFPPYAKVAPLVIDRVAILVTRFIPPESSELIYSDTVNFNVNSNTLRLNLQIPMENATEDVGIEIEMLAGNTLLFSGFSSATLVRGQSLSNVDLPLTYSGPGSNVTSLLLSPRDTVLLRGQTMDFTLDAFDIQGAEVPQYYAHWSLSGAASSARLNAVGHLTASSVNDTFFVVVATPNAVLDSARVIVTDNTTQPSTTLTWTGAASTDFSAAGNWSPAQAPGINDSLVIGATASQRQPTLTTQTVVGAISIITGGNLTIGGFGISVLRGFSTGGTGVLSMLFPNDVVAIQGDAVFDGGNELNLLEEGALSVAGNLTQRATNSGDSYHPSNNHLTILLGANPTLSFATPGLVPGTSHFQGLAWIGSGTLTLATQVMAHDELIISGTGAATITSSNGSRLTVGNIGSVGQLALNNVPLTISQTTSGAIDLANITFQNMPTNVSQLVVSHPGGGTFDFDNLVFSTTPVAPNGFYIDATDINSQTDGFLTIDMNSPSPASPGAFLRVTGGAVVNWPAGTATTRTWSGATNTNWSTASNWVGGVAPGATDSAVIVAATNSPQVLSTVSVGAVNVASGNLEIGDAALTVARGFATTGTGTLTMQSGAGLAVGGSVIFAGGSTAGLLDNGTITVGGNFTQVSGTSPLSFAAGPNNRVILTNTLPNVAFTSPGAAASRFGTLEQGQNATGFTFNSSVVITGNLDGPDGFSGEIFGTGVSLTLANGTGCCVDLNGVVLIIDDPTGNASGVSGVTFTNIPTTATQLTIRSPGNGSSFSVSAINWRTLSAGNTGSYLDVTDLNGATGGTLAVTVSSNDPGNGPTFTKTGGGALVFWPGSQVSWTGAFNTDWADPRNWNNLRVPFQNNLLIPAGTPNAPAVISSVPQVGDLTVASGQTVSIQNGGTLRSIGNVTATGNIVTAGSGVLSLEGTAKTATGNVGATTVTGSYTLAGNLTAAAGSVVDLAGSLNLGGHTLRAPTVSVSTTAGLLVMANPTDSLIATTGVSFQGADETGQLTAGVIATQGNFTVGGVIPNHFMASGTHKVLLNGSGTQQIGFPAGTNSRFQNLQIAIGAGLSAALSGSTVNVAGDLAITSGQLAMNGRRVNVGGNFSTSGTGVLNMNNAGDSLFITGNATFAGGSTVGTLGNGVLKISGDFTQSAATSVTSFSPNGLHKTILGGAAAADISMGSPGLGGTGSHFQVLDVSSATGGIILDIDMQADSLISTAPAARIEGPLVALTARRAQVTGLTFFNTRFILDEQGGFAPQTFSNVTFTGYPANSTGLVLFTFIGPGGAAAARPAPVTTNVNFTPQLGVGAANFYVDLTSSNGFQVNLTMTGSNQGATAGGNGSALTRVTPATGVATVAWP